MPIDLDHYRLPKGFKWKTPSRPLRSRILTDKRFVKGPIPLEWLETCASLPGKALHVGLVLWYLAGLKRTKTFALDNTSLEKLGVKRGAKARCLADMERAGLIGIESHAGRNPVITLIDAPERAPDPTPAKPDEIS